MRFFTTMLLAVVAVAACSSTQDGAESTTADGSEVLADAMVTEIGSHGNGYTNLMNSTLDSAGVKAGDRIVLKFNEKEFVFTVGNAYSDVPEGENVAVLHREGTIVLAVNNGLFNEIHDIEPGAKFSVVMAPEE